MTAGVMSADAILKNPRLMETQPPMRKVLAGIYATRGCFAVTSVSPRTNYNQRWQAISSRELLPT